MGRGGGEVNIPGFASELSVQEQHYFQEQEGAEKAAHCHSIGLLVL